MKSSNTLSWESSTNKKLSRELRTFKDVLITNSTNDLVEYYWSNQKRFSGSYKGFPVEVKKLVFFDVTE